MSHVREARMLCRKTVDLFTLLSRTQDPSSSSSASDTTQRMGMTQELLALVTGLAHYLKILIRIALTGALKLEKEHGNPDGLASFLDHLQCLALEGGDPQARRVRGVVSTKHVNESTPSLAASLTSTTNTAVSIVGMSSNTDGVAYGYKSLGPELAGESPFSSAAIIAASSGGGLSPPSDLCVSCRLTVEEDCVRLGTYQRWHSHCVKCVTCGKVAAVLPPKSGAEGIKGSTNGEGDAQNLVQPKISSARRPPANVDDFRYEMTSSSNISEQHRSPDVHTIILCTSHARMDSRNGFCAVSRLEQYAFLLNVALRRLYLLLKKRGVMPPPSCKPFPNSVKALQTCPLTPVSAIDACLLCDSFDN